MASNGRHDETVSPLGRYWDALVQGRSADPAGLDPALAAAVRHLHAHDDALAADRRFADHLLEDLMHVTTQRNRSAVDLAPGLSQVPANRAAVRPMPRTGTPEPRQALAQFATAALLLLTVAASLVAFGAGRFARQRDAPVFLPAIGGTSATPSAIAGETLFDAVVDGLPSGAGTAQLLRWTLRPSPQALVIPPAEGVRFFVVESGEVAATEAGVEHRLAAGDVYIAANPEQEVVFQLSGPEDATLLRGLVAKTLTTASFDPAAHEFVFLIEAFTDALPGGSGRVVLERLTLAPGAALPPGEIGSYDWTALSGGTLGVTLEGDDLPFPWKAGEERTVRSASLFPSPLAAGTWMTLRNAGAEPLVLYRMTLAPSRMSITPAP